MAFSMAGGGPSRPQMNVTPLIDVLLVLIIVFMVVVIEQRPTGLQTELPQSNPTGRFRFRRRSGRSSFRSITQSRERIVLRQNIRRQSIRR